MTDREQLIEMRKAMLTERMQGQSPASIDIALRNVTRMNFEDHAEFMNWVAETSGTGVEQSVTVATDAELDAMAESMGFGASMEEKLSTGGKATTDEMEEIFKHMNI